MKRCTKQEDKEDKSKSPPSKWMMKKCSTKSKNKKSEVRSWADLDLDLLGEIKKKLYYRDHARFSGVCKTWMEAQHEERVGDVLPMVMLLFQQVEDVDEISYDLYEPLNLDQPVISQVIYLNQFFDTSCLRHSKSIDYVDGCLFLSMSNIDFTATHFLLVSIPTSKCLTIPQFNHPQPFHIEYTLRILKAVSTYPLDPDCVFLALHVANHHHWSIGIFRHGDTEWNTTEFDFPEPFGEPCRHKSAVFIRGVFYFLCHDQRLASYDIASRELKVESFSAPVDYKGIYNFFGLDGELMLLYFDYKVNKRFLTTYDSSLKLWVPLKNLGDRSLFLGNHSVYVDYYGVSANKIYVHRHGICSVYSFDNDELESSSSGLKYWSGLNYPEELSLWVEPCDLLPK